MIQMIQILILLLGLAFIAVGSPMWYAEMKEEKRSLGHYLMYIGWGCVALFWIIRIFNI